jgi:transcriptional regulator EpsA
MQASAQDVDVGTDRELLLNIIERATEVINADEFMDMINNEVSRLLPHEVFACGFGGVSPKGSYVHKVLQKNSPNEYYLELLQPDGRIDSPLMTRWRNTQQPVMFQSGRDDHEYPADWIRIFNKYNLQNTIAHGVLDMQGALTSYFIFSRNQGEVGLKHIYLLKLLTPHLHVALVRVLATLQDFGDYAGAIHTLISERQRQIIHWLHEGKTNWEIARILGMTEKNVKYHVEQILLKLDVRNRTQAVACAVGLGLLSQTSAVPQHLCALSGSKEPPYTGRLN